MNQTQNTRIKNLFNWGELSRLLSGTRSVVLKNKYPKKHEPFINDLCEAVRPVMVKHGYETADSIDTTRTPDTPNTPEAAE